MACLHFFRSSITSFLLLTFFRNYHISCRGTWLPLPDLLVSTLLWCITFGCGYSLCVWSDCYWVIYWTWPPSLPSWSYFPRLLEPSPYQRWSGSSKSRDPWNLCAMDAWCYPLHWASPALGIRFMPVTNKTTETVLTAIMPFSIVSASWLKTADCKVHLQFA